jgi:hypothetical protein
MREIRTLITAGLAAALVVAGGGLAAAHQPGGPQAGPGMGHGMMQGQQMGPGMMGQGPGPGPMMGQGAGHGAAMRPYGQMAGPGPMQHMHRMHHMQSGMMMGPHGMHPSAMMHRNLMGWQMGPGMMGRGLGPGWVYGMPGAVERDLDVDEVRSMMERRLAWHGNPRLKLGEVRVDADDDDLIVADIVTVDDSLVQRLIVDRHTGQFRQTR